MYSALVSQTSPFGVMNFTDSVRWKQPSVFSRREAAPVHSMRSLTAFGLVDVKTSKRMTSRDPYQGARWKLQKWERICTDSWNFIRTLGASERKDQLIRTAPLTK